MMAQYNAPALRSEIYEEFEALRKKMREFSGRVAEMNPHFNQTEFDRHASEVLDADRQDLTRLLDDADEAWTTADEDEEVELYGTDFDQHATHRVINGRHF